MSDPEFPGRTRSPRAIADTKARALLQSAGMTEQSKSYAPYLAALTKVYEDGELHPLQVLLVIAEQLEYLTTGEKISEDQLVRLRGLAAGLQHLKRKYAPNMSAVETFVKDTAVPLQLNEERKVRQRLEASKKGAEKRRKKGEKTRKRVQNTGRVGKLSDRHIRRIGKKK